MLKLILLSFIMAFIKIFSIWLKKISDKYKLINMIVKLS